MPTCPDCGKNVPTFTMNKTLLFVEHWIKDDAQGVEYACPNSHRDKGAQ